MTVTLDASVVVAALVDSGADGEWAEGLLVEDLAAPHLLPVEVANMMRRAVAAGEIADDLASIAYGDLLDLSIEFVPYELVAARVWELRSNVTAYDAWYVAVAELLGTPLATLDQKLVAAPGPRCRFLVP